MNRFSGIMAVAGFAALLANPHSADAQDEWIEVPVLVNVQKDVIITDEKIEEAIKEANEILKQAKVKLKFNKNADIKKNFNDQGNTTTRLKATNQRS
jgi:hypothetical protein